jgi:hypothetical protein
MRLLTGLQALSLEYNNLTFLPNATFQGLSHLQHLCISDNPLHLLHERAFEGLVALESLVLGNTHLISLPENLFQGLPQLRRISLWRNHRLISLPERLFQGLENLDTLTLFYNPQLVISLDKFLDSPLYLGNNIAFRETMHTFFTYSCESSLAQVFQLVAGNPTLEAVSGAFSQLPDSIKHAIWGCVWEEADGHRSRDPHWGEHHAFDNMPIFCRALKRYVRNSFAALNKDQKNAVYGHVYNLARSEPGAENINFGSPRWGEEHALEHLLRLIDAMIRLQRLV